MAHAGARLARRQGGIVTSLARQLKLWLLPMFLAAAIVAASTTYFVFGAAVNWFMDSQLVGIAEAHAVQAPAAVQRSP